MLIIREAEAKDLEGLLELYTFLNVNPFPKIDSHLLKIWSEILKNEYQHVIVAEEDERLVATCTMIIVPNITHGVHNYAFIENVVSHGDYRHRGLASKVMDYARDLASKNDCYKIMLLTSHKDTIPFYIHNGYDQNDKNGLVLWLGRKD